MSAVSTFPDNWGSELTEGQLAEERVPNVPSLLEFSCDEVGTGNSHWSESGTENMPVLRSRELPRRSERQIQEWEGFVVGVGSNSFTARLAEVPDVSGSYEDTEVEIPLLEVDPLQLKYLEPGAIFRWVISYVSEPGKHRYRSSVLVFRQLPRNESKLPRSVEEIFDGINWE